MLSLYRYRGRGSTVLLVRLNSERMFLNFENQRAFLKDQLNVVYARRLAIDPTSGNIYYTGYVKTSYNDSYIAVLTPYGDHVQIIISLKQPRGIVLHPENG